MKHFMRIFDARLTAFAARTHEHCASSSSTMHEDGAPMTLTPLLTASVPIQIHAFAAMLAFLLGLVQFTAPKGTLPHRALGWLWVALMTIVATSAFFIHTLKIWGIWSPIHLLAVYHARHAAACRLARAQPSHRQPQAGDDRHVRFRACSGWRVHFLAGPHHARRCFWRLIIEASRTPARDSFRARRGPTRRKAAALGPQGPAARSGRGALLQSRRARNRADRQREW